MSQTTIVRYLQDIKGQEDLIIEQKNTVDKNNNLKKLKDMLEKDKKEGKKRKKGELAKELGVANSTITKYMKILEEQGSLSEEETTVEEKSKRKVEPKNRFSKRYKKFYGQESSLKIFQEYLNNCKQREKEKTIEEDELEAVKYATMATENYEDVALYLRLCIRFNQFEGALKFARTYQNCESFTAEERLKTKKSIERCEKFCKAIDMILRKKRRR